MMLIKIWLIYNLIIFEMRRNKYNKLPIFIIFISPIIKKIKVKFCSNYNRNFCFTFLKNNFEIIRTILISDNWIIVSSTRNFQFAYVITLQHCEII